MAGIMNGKSKIFKDGDYEETAEFTPPPTPVRPQTEPNQRVYKSILLNSGSIVSLSLLISKGKFKRVKLGTETGGAAGKLMFEVLS